MTIQTVSYISGKHTAVSTLLSFLVFSILSFETLAATTLVIDSWRIDDQAVWQNKILPLFEATHPDISVKFRATPPADYDTQLKSRLNEGSAADLITCRPFDFSLALYQSGYLKDLSDLAGLSNFSPAAKSAWQTDDASATYCVPIAAVIHGFIFNRDVFEELNLEIPQTETEFFAVLERIQTREGLIPLALGVRDRWEAATMGYNNIGPNYWHGETGRLALIDGLQKFTDEQWVAPFRTLATWRKYLGEGYQERSYQDSQKLFVSGRAAVYPAGSWEIAGFNDRADFRLGAFRPPVRKAGDECFISDHVDMAIGLNPASPNQAAAYRFLNWISTSEFASIYANALPGFFPLSNHEIAISDPLAKTFHAWRNDCHSTIRVATQKLSRGTPRLEIELWDAAVEAIAGTSSADELAAGLQKSLANWYLPQK